MKATLTLDEFYAMKALLQALTPSDAVPRGVIATTDGLIVFQWSYYKDQVTIIIKEATDGKKSINT